MTEIQKEDIAEAYEDVRNDASPTNWALLGYDENNTIVLSGTGDDFDEFRGRFNDDERLFGFLRVTTGEEPNFKSKRAKFVLITWIGANVSALKRAKVSTDKTLVKAVLQNFALEIQTSDLHELDEEHIKGLVVKAGGANYGTGTRD
jgi:hypothetical protein